MVKKALVYNGRVVDVTTKKPFPVHPDLKWEDAPTEVKIGWRFQDGTFTDPNAEESPTP